MHTSFYDCRVAAGCIDVHVHKCTREREKDGCCRLWALRALLYARCIMYSYMFGFAKANVQEKKIASRLYISMYILGYARTLSLLISMYLGLCILHCAVSCWLLQFPIWNSPLFLTSKQSIWRTYPCTCTYVCKIYNIQFIYMYRRIFVKLETV